MSIYEGKNLVNVKVVCAANGRQCGGMAGSAVPAARKKTAFALSYQNRKPKIFIGLYRRGIVSTESLIGQISRIKEYV